MRIPTNSSSNPNWLEKLRKVKGFQSEEAQTIDHFLPQQQVANYVNDSHPVKRRASTHGNDNVSTRMANMLSDLFNGRSRVGRSSNFKAPRKQSNPRIFVLPDVDVVVEDKGSNESERVSGNEEEDVNWSLGLERKVGRKEGRRFGEGELVGFSRTEVTVIDTSNPLWKFDKYLFRKKNVWKARDCRRGRARHFENKNSVGFGRKKKRECIDDAVSKKSKSFIVRK